MNSTLNYFQFGPIPQTVMHGYYNYRLVALSFVIVLMTIFVAFNCVDSMRRESTKSMKYCWLIGCAIIMGSGIWSMHFIGMLAYQLPISTSYDPLWTSISLLIALMGSAMVFFILLQTKITNMSLILSGLFLGLTIVTTHFVGMEAIENINMQGVVYRPFWYITSIVVAIVGSIAATMLALKNDTKSVNTKLYRRIGSSIILCTTIAIKYYTAMQGTIFIPHPHGIIDIGNTIVPETLSLYITILIGFIITLALIILTQRQLVLYSFQEIQKQKNLYNAKTIQNKLEELVEKRTTELTVRNNELSSALDKLKLAQEKLIQTEKLALVGQLAAGIAHEINNPLAYVITNLTILEKDYEWIKKFYDLTLQLTDTIQSANIENIRKTADSLLNHAETNTIITELNDLIKETNEGVLRIKQIVMQFSHFSGNGNAFIESVDINHCIQSSIELISNQLKYKCTVHQKLNHLPSIIGSPEQLEMVFINLLLNAVQSIPDKGDITISSDWIRDNIVILITDTGVGIAPENMHKLFTPFFTTKEPGAGAGIGLSTSYTIIKAHGGDISVSSELNKGSIFTITLPAVRKNDVNQRN